MFTVRTGTTRSARFAHLHRLLAALALSVWLTGCDSASIAPSLQANLQQIDFGELATDQTLARTVTVSNPSQQSALHVETLYLDERDALNYSTDIDGDTWLAAGESLDITVRFHPASPGDKTGALFITHSGDGNRSVIQLNGRGLGATEATQKTAAPDIARALQSVSFGKSQLNGIGNFQPTSLQFGPDQRLYAAALDGVIHVFDVTRNGANSYSVSALEQITLVRDIPNHDDDGSSNPGVNSRLVTGIAVTGSAAEPIVYVNSSDPRIGGGGSGLSTNLDTNSGILSKLVKQGDNWIKTDLVRGLPRSEENHHNNGIALSGDGTALYIAMGGNTNMGAPSNNFAKLPEYALSAAILEVDLAQIGDTTYDLPTLDDEDRPGVIDFNDPFGGNRGKNQAKIVLGGPVQVYAPGFRNAYDIVVTQGGKMYTWDNGPNSGWGAEPIGDGPQGYCSNAINEPGQTRWDTLHYISARGYYGGHPNPVRGNMANTFNSGNPQSPVPFANPVECHYRGPEGSGLAKHPQNQSLMAISSSTNGLTEYTASNFGGAMAGDLLTASFDNTIYRVQLTAGGESVASSDALFSNVGSLPLDVTTVGDTGPFPGTIWAADFYGRAIVVFEPADYDDADNAVCDPSDPLQDADQDGYSNADENANGTSACSSADIPFDADGDFLSDLYDSDDDNDNLDDASDPFALDPQNGAGTAPYFHYDWENDSSDPGFLAGTGFSGLISNGVDDYQSLYDLSQMTIRGAAGVVTVDNIGAGSAAGAANDQMFGFQLGVDVSPASPVLRARTRVISPFNGIAPTDGQSIGLFIGNGDQDNYIMLAITAAGLIFASEINGDYSATFSAAPVQNTDYIDLSIEFDPATQTARALYQITADGDSGALQPLPASVSFPLSWLTGSSKLAVGIIASAGDGQSFPATWDFIEVLPVDATPAQTGDIVARINAGGPTISAPDGDWIADTQNQYFNTGSLYASAATIDTAAVDNVPAELFQTERWDPAGGAEMSWQIPVTPGQYEVRLYFAELWSGAFDDGVRVFDLNVEGQTASGIDVYAAAGGNRAWMKSFVVDSDATIDIQFLHDVENPDVNGIEIIRIGATDSEPRPNTAPLVSAGADKSAVVDSAISVQGSAQDDGLPASGSVTLNWSQLSGPGDATFANHSAAATSVSFDQPGSYILMLSASDGELSGSDTLAVTVSNTPAAQQPATINGVPVCLLEDSDSDGDGWGWENSASCIVADLPSTDSGTDNTATDNTDDGVDDASAEETSTDDTPQPPHGGDDTPATTIGGVPVCQSAASDPDGDGWGWENSASCIVSADSSGDAVADSPQPDASDDGSDGSDGNDNSGGTPICASAASDSDGDGWGWENNASCIVAN